jgi:hypothetical protein
MTVDARFTRVLRVQVPRTQLWRGAMDLPVMSEVVFEVTKESTGGYDAESDTENLSAQGDTWEQLCDNVKTTVERYFQDGPKPQSIRLHHVREEILPLT